jgi:replicative DNA helicase
MGDVSILQRAVWQISRVDSGRVKRGKLSGDERDAVKAAVHEVYSLPMWVDERSYSMTEIHAKLRQLRSRGPLGLVVVDYLQLLRDSGRHGTRAEAVGANARALKILAGEFECPVLLLSQFNRESAKGTGNQPPRRPELYDLKESGDIENHANGVWFIHRQDTADSECVSVEFMLPKQRDGRRNISQGFWFFPKCQRFDAKDNDSV